MMHMKVPKSFSSSFHVGDRHCQEYGWREMHNRRCATELHHLLRCGNCTFLSSSLWTAARDCNYSRHWDHDKDLGGQCSNYHLILVENLERNLLPSSLRDFIHEHTSVLSQVHVFPCPSYMPYARGIIVADCEKKLQKIQQFLDNPIHLIVSSRGRCVF